MPGKDMQYRKLLAEVPTKTEALKRCCLLGGMEPEEMAYRLKINYSHFQRMMNPHDARYLPTELEEKLMREAGNLFPLDWMERRFGRCAYPLEFMAIIDEIRRSLSDEGRAVRFALKNLPKDLPWP
jgi:hypothetical protein